MWEGGGQGAGREEEGSSEGGFNGCHCVERRTVMVEKGMRQRREVKERLPEWAYLLLWVE